MFNGQENQTAVKATTVQCVTFFQTEISKCLSFSVPLNIEINNLVWRMTRRSIQNWVWGQIIYSCRTLQMKAMKAMFQQKWPNIRVLQVHLDLNMTTQQMSAHPK